MQKTADEICAEVVALREAMPVGAMSPLSHESFRTQDRETKALASNVLESLTHVSSRWLGAVAPVFESLIQKAQDSGVTDAELVQAIETAALAFPDYFGRLDSATLAHALTKSMGAALVNGVLQREQEFSKQ